MAEVMRFWLQRGACGGGLRQIALTRRLFGKEAALVCAVHRLRTASGKEITGRLCCRALVAQGFV